MKKLGKISLLTMALTIAMGVVALADPGTPIRPQYCASNSVEMPY